MDDLVNKSGNLVNDLVNDTISRTAAIDAFAPYAEYDSNRTNAEWVRRINMVLSGLPPAQPGWIPVTERLPENNNDVLVTDGTDCAVAYWRTDAQAWDDCMHGWCDLYGLEVVAWQPLPTPYREGGQDEQN